MSEEIRTESLDNASDEVYALIEANFRFMNKAEADVFSERIHSMLYEFMRNLSEPPTETCHFCQHSKFEHRKPGETFRQMPCGHTDIDPEDESEVPCLCYGFTTSKEESEKLAAEPNQRIYNQEGLKYLLERIPRELWGVPCVMCNHALQAHYSPGGCAGSSMIGSIQCGCNKFAISATTAEQFESYLQSAPPSRSSQFQEPQLPSHSQDKYLRDHIAGVQQARKANTLRLSLPEVPELSLEQLYQISLALLTFGEVECQFCHTLVARALSSLRLSLKSSHPTHKEHSPLPPAEPA